LPGLTFEKIFPKCFDSLLDIFRENYVNQANTYKIRNWLETDLKLKIRAFFIMTLDIWNAIK